MRVGLEKNQEDQYVVFPLKKSIARLTLAARIQRFIFACSQASVDIDGHVGQSNSHVPTF